MRRILLAFIFTVAVSGMAFAAVENIKVSGDITTTAVTRDLSLGADAAGARTNFDSEEFFATQVRLRFDADLTENVSAVVQLINERIWGTEVENIADDTDVNLDLAYLEMKEMLYEPLTLTIGRQVLRFGRAFIIGDYDTDDVVSGNSGLNLLADDLSLRKSFDAVRATLDYDPLVIDLVYASIQENVIDENDDVELLGFNAGYQLNEDTLVELYFWNKEKDNRGVGPLVDPAAGVGAGIRGQPETHVSTVGLRAETELTDQISLYGEYGFQFGDYIRNVAPFQTQDRRAWATQVGGDFKLQDANDTNIGLEYGYFSASDDAVLIREPDARWETWDPMFEDQKIGEIFNAMFNTGFQYVKLSASTMPREDITAILDLYWFRLSEHQALGQAAVLGDSFGGRLSGGAAVVNVDPNEAELGWELDLTLKYDYTEDVQMGLVSGWFMPGDWFSDENNETAYSIRSFAKVEF